VCGLPSTLDPLAVRAGGFCRYFEESGVEVLHFQEVWTRRALAVLRARLPSYPHVAWRRGFAGQPAGGLATFSRLPLGAVSYTPFRVVWPDRGGLPFRLVRAVRSALQGVLLVELAGLATVVANTHLTANGDGDWSGGNRYLGFQRAQLERLHAALGRAGTDLVVVAGDFNIASDGPLYPLIVDGWHDPFAATDPVTFHAAFLPPGASGHRIDYLLVRGGRVIGSELLFAEPDGQGRYLSDHMALTASVQRSFE
jgi:endonuclease/exonuclease/phosphatase family metal-dependent hydrolase